MKMLRTTSVSTGLLRMCEFNVDAGLVM
uniref:Uncharacterized protein n=1 Tax=Arundo donax TaxID=35708 RepID=A0A0A8ZT89_ARUDO